MRVSLLCLGLLGVASAEHINCRQWDNNRMGCQRRPACIWFPRGNGKGSCKEPTPAPTIEYEEYEEEYEYEYEYEKEYEYEGNPEICTNECGFANDGECDDGGDGAAYNECGHGTDCNDCGIRHEQEYEYEDYVNWDSEDENGLYGEYSEDEYEEYEEYEYEYEDQPPCGLGTYWNEETELCEIHYEFVCGEFTTNVQGQCQVDMQGMLTSSNSNEGPFKCTADRTLKFNTRSPTFLPTDEPTMVPTVRPTLNPTARPTRRPSQSPTANPTKSPTAPTDSPTSSPTSEPTSSPTSEPTSSPTYNCPNVRNMRVCNRAPGCMVVRQGRRSRCDFTPPPTAAPTTDAPTAAPTSSPTEQGFSPPPTGSPTSYCAQLSVKKCRQGTFNAALCKIQRRGRRRFCVDK